MPVATPDSDPSWFGFPITVKENSSFSKNDLISFLSSKLIDTRTVFAGNITKQPYFKNVEHRKIGNLSNTDLVMKWGLFTRDSVLAIWSFIFMLMALYILGKISMPFDSKVNSLSKRRIILGIGTLMFGLYLGLGLSSNFKINGLIESYLPPPTIENTHNESDGWLLNLDDAYIKASKENMPIFIDFTGYTCTNCRWMEINIFPLPEVKNLLNDNFILVKLYTDGKEEIHKKNKELEKQRFGTVALPYYVVLSPSDNELGTFPGMDPNKDNFIDFLNESYNKFLDE